MKKIDTGQMIAVLANVGVIAGIAFLAFELRQNNSLLRAQASFNLLQNRIEYRTDIVRDPEFAEFWAENLAGGRVSATQLRVLMHVQRTFLNWQYEYGQYLDGHLAEGEFSVTALRNAFGDGQVRGTWELFKEQLRPDFVQWMEENVVAESP